MDNFTLSLKNQLHERKCSNPKHRSLVVRIIIKLMWLFTSIYMQVYAVHFKCNKKLLREYPNLFNYTKDLFQIPGMSSTVNMEHIKKHYYGSHPMINPYGIIPLGPNIDYLAPHDRDRFAS
ncbi:putative glutathione S-transferase Omega/GSH, glutathione S-transferase domain superfamily [Helianthus annuus]|nr:putative glutathione S-transferase Omega/GSH, glutathione S-transferase domain superfamily [Helianthus annuus]